MVDSTLDQHRGKGGASVPDMGGHARRPSFDDYVALWIVKLAKLARKRMSGSSPGGDGPAGDAENYQKFYEQFFLQKDIEVYSRDLRMSLRRETIAAFLRRGVPAGAALLDVGCGLGDVLEGLPPEYRLFGVDYAQSNVQIAAKRLGARAAIQQCGIYAMPFADGSMDACLCLEVLEHIEDDARGVREIARVTRPGGLLIAAVPYTYYWPDYKRLMGHFRHYTRASFSELLAANGFTVQEHLPNYPHWHQSYARKFALTRAKAILFGWLFGCRSPYAFKWPWQKTTTLARVAERLEPLRRSDEALRYSEEATSTFVVAAKARA